jgi:hypothetical protein
LRSEETIEKDAVMEPECWPLDPVTAAALVVRTIDAIDGSDVQEREALLEDLLAAAWGTPGACNQ